MTERLKLYILAFYDGETLCGLVYMATLGKQTFIMFFAVDAKLRSKGYDGYLETGYFMKLAGQEQEIMIKNGVFDKRSFTVFFKLYSCCAGIPKI